MNRQPAINGKKYFYQEVIPVEAKDTMGAGDSFISAFLTSYFGRKDFEEIKFERKSDFPWNNSDRIADSLKEAAEYAAAIVVKDGSLGFGYDVDPEHLTEVLHI